MSMELTEKQLEKVIMLINDKRCISCEDKIKLVYNWRIPLCRFCRIKYLGEGDE